MHKNRVSAYMFIGIALSAALFTAEAEAPAEREEACRRTIDFEGVTRAYFVRLPIAYVPTKTYWPLITVHGGGGNGRSHFLAKDMRREADAMGLEAIVVSPSFSNTDVQASRFPALGEGKFLHAVLEDLQCHYQLHNKILLTGYSRGGQFSHRFAFQYPEQVKAVAPFAAGTWTTPAGSLLIERLGEVAQPAVFLSDPENAVGAPERLKAIFTPRVAKVAGVPARSQAKTVPFLVMCGSLDTRYEIAQRFAKSLDAAGYTCKTAWPRTPHGSRDNEAFATEFNTYARNAVAFFIAVTKKR